jgi:hypothetical protein
MPIIWENWLQNISFNVLGVDELTGGIMISLVFIIIMVMMILLITKAKKADATMPLTMCLGFCFFIVLGWFPLFVGSVLALICALIFARQVSGG